MRHEEDRHAALAERSPRCYIAASTGSDAIGGHDAVGNRVGTGLIGPLVATHAPDGKRSETPFNRQGDVFVDLVDGSVWVWTHSEGARPDRGRLVIAALEGETNALKQKIAELEQQDGLVERLWDCVDRLLPATLLNGVIVCAALAGHAWSC